MKQLKIDIPEGYEIDKEKSTFENIVFKNIEDKYPSSVKKIERRYYIDNFGDIEKNRINHNIEDLPINNVSSEKRARAFLALMQLVELRDAWNKIDGFKVDWTNSSQHQIKYCIVVYEDKIKTTTRSGTTCQLYFGNSKTANKFLEIFKDLIEQAKELL